MRIQVKKYLVPELATVAITLCYPLYLLHDATRAMGILAGLLALNTAACFMYARAVFKRGKDEE